MVECTDHLGNHYQSLRAMCAYWGVLPATYENRVESGMSVEEALTSGTQKGKAHARRCVDHLGNYYDSLRAMCDAYGIDACTFSNRVKIGWSVEQALTTPVKRQVHIEQWAKYSGKGN